MGRIVLFYSFILFVAITSTLCKGERVRVNSTHQEFSCGHQQGIWVDYVSRVDEAYCGKDTSTCSWTNTTTFPESCSIDSLPQLIYKCNGNNNCSDVYSILNETMCCNGTAREPTCRNSKHFDIYFDCVQDLWILDLDTDKETSTESWLFIRAPKKSDNLCECSVRSIPSNSFDYYYCDTSMHYRSCTRVQYSSKQRNFSFYPNKLSSLLLDTIKWKTGDTLKVNCSCSSDDQRITSTLNPLTTSNVETPITEKEKEKTGITEKEKEKTGITEKEKEKTGITEKEKEKNDQRITSTLNPLTTSNVETPITEKEKEKTGISEKEKEKTSITEKEKEKTGITEKEKEKTGITEKEKEKIDGSIMVVLIASVVGNVLQIIVTTVLVVYLCKKRRSSVNYSSATVSSPTDNEQYVNFRRNDVLYDDCDVAPPGNDNSNVPEETATYHNIET